MRRKGLEDLNVYSISRKQDDKVREDLNVSRGCCGALRGTGPRATGTGGCVFFGALRGTGPRATGTETRFLVVRGTGPRDRALILAILTILAILLQTL